MQLRLIPTETPEDGYEGMSLEAQLVHADTLINQLSSEAIEKDNTIRALEAEVNFLRAGLREVS